MNETKLLIGSLSNDLFRVAQFSQRGSASAAQRFMKEAKRWAEPLVHAPVKKYISDIAHQVYIAKTDDISLKEAETYLMYGVLLQNYALHFDET